MLPALRKEPDSEVEHPLFWEHVGNAAVRSSTWKLVRIADEPWELYDISTDRTELRNVAKNNPEVVQELAWMWQQWADSVGVIPWDKMRETVRTHGG